MNYLLFNKMNTIANRISVLLITLILISHSGKGQNINIPNKTGPMGLEVNSYTGNLFFERTDCVIEGTGLNMVVGFSYNSYSLDINRGYGNGWSFKYDVHYKIDSSENVIIIWGDGREDVYEPIGNGNYKAPVGNYTVLKEYEPGKFSLTETDGRRFLFENGTIKRLTKIDEPNGNFITLQHTDTLITSLTNNYGQSIQLTYDNKGWLTTITDAITSPTRIWTYSYDGVGNLTAATDPLGAKDAYSYMINGPVKSVTDKNFNVVDLVYYNDFAVSEMVGCNKRMSFSYDTSQKMTVVTEHLESGVNQVTKYYYKTFNKLQWLSAISSNCCGFDVVIEYDQNGNKIKETDANGNATRYTYDDNGNILTITNALNQTTTFTYTIDFNLVKSVKDPKGNMSTMEYDAKGNLVKITDPGNSIYTATYNAYGNVISSTNPKGKTFTYTYDANGKLQNVNGPEGISGTLNFSPRGDLLTYSDGNNSSRTFQYDILGRITQITDPLNNNSKFSYDAAGNLIVIRNKNNEPSQFQYDASNRMREISGPMSKNLIFGYDGMDNITSITDAKGATTYFEYGNKNLLSKMADAEGNQTTFSYDRNGNLITRRQPSGRTLTYTYDALNRIKEVKDEEGILGGLEYDANGNMTKYTNPVGAVNNFEYDNQNRMRKYTDALGNIMELTYNVTGKVKSLKDKMGKISNLVYDDLDRIKSFTDNNGSITKVSYDAVGNVLSLTDANNNITSYTYDALNRVKRETFPDGKYHEYEYDVKNNIISHRDKNGSTMLYTYDSLSRPVTKTFSDGQAYSYTYDKTGKVISATNGAGTVYFTYDILNRLTSEKFNGRTVSYSYDINGHTQKTIYPDNTEVTKTFDTRNRLVSIQKNNNTIVTYQYNNADQLTGKVFSNGVSTSLQYDFASRLTNMVTGDIQNLSFTYDKNGNRTSIIRGTSNQSEFFTYDNGNRLTSYKRGIDGGPFTVNDTYNYDGLGNRISANIGGKAITYTVNQLNQMVSSNDGTKTINYIYDNNGNLTFDGKYFKTYDIEKRLLKDSASPTEVIAYQYDVLGRKITKTLNGVVSHYTYAGFQSIEERDQYDFIKNRTVFNNFLEPVLNEKDDVPFYYHQNYLNSIESLTDGSGSLVEKYQYDAYGKQTILDANGNVIPGSLTGNRFGFTGQVFDSATGHNQFVFRNYNPETGLFDQQDLIGYGDGMGMYQYVGNNPANGIDVFGLEGDSDPCGNFSDVNKVRIITRKMRIQQQEKVVREAHEGFWKTTWIYGDYYAGVTADSRFYTDFKLTNGNGLTVGGNEFYFDGKVMPNYEANYYFTAYANASRGWSKTSNVNLTKGWNIGKAQLGNLTNGGDPAAFNARMNQTDPKVALAKKASDEYNNLESGLESIEIPEGYEYKESGFGEWWPVYNKETKEITYEFFVNRDRIKDVKQIEYIKKHYKKGGDCPQNGNPNGTQRPPHGPHKDGPSGRTRVLQSNDPNEMIGPKGQPDKRWVSVNDRLPYTVTYENSEMATAPAKYVKVIVPAHEKMDPSTFQLSNLGFNNMTFNVPPMSPSNYQRLDARDSLGLLIDMTAGFDPMKNEFFWEFQSINPVTMMPPSDPLKGFLLMQDTTELKTNNGHGFVTFSVKPVANAQTLDSILAYASIVFDQNDTIPTNIEKNVIDAVAPTSQLNQLDAAYTNSIPLSWSGQDDPKGSGVMSYTLYVSTDGTNYTIVRSGITRTDTTFKGLGSTKYFFFVLATDSVGNTETLRPGAVMNTYLGSVLPLTWLYFKGINHDKNNLLEWATANEMNTKEFKVERSFDAQNFTGIGTVRAVGNSTGNSSYQYTDHDIDRLGETVMYYRLAQIDQDGRTNLSNVIRLNYESTGMTKTIVYPNPTKGMITVIFGDPTLVGSIATMYDEAGKVLQSVKITSVNQAFNLSNYSNGIYFIKLANKEVLKIMKH